MFSKLSLVVILVVAMQLVSANPLLRDGWGLARVKNGGGYTARFRLEYFVEGKHHKEQTGSYPVGQTKTILIPPNAINIVLIAENNIFINSWSTVTTYAIIKPELVCFEMSGTTLKPKFNKVDCQ